MITNDKSLFSNDRFLGYISKVTRSGIFVQIPNSVLVNPFWENGREYIGGIVGNFVVIEGQNYGFLAKIREVSIPENDIEKINNEVKEKNKSEITRFHPMSIVDILLCFDYYDEKLKPLSHFPQVGSKVFLCEEQFLEEIISKKDSETATKFDFASIQNKDTVTVQISSKSLFERHCAIIGNTGGGKSWTVAKILEEILDKETNKKVILIDATGEYCRFANNNKVIPIYFGNEAPDIETADKYKKTHYDYKKFTFTDLRLLLRPSPQSQTPKLLDAVKSLKIVKYYKDNQENITADLKEEIEYYIRNDLFEKKGKHKTNYYKIYSKIGNYIDKDDTNIDIKQLARQVYLECVNESGETWTNIDERSRGFQTTLVNRINSIKLIKSLNDTFNLDDSQQEASNITTIIAEFLNDETKKMLLLDLSNADFDFNVREILVNVIGKELLNMARKGKFKEKPLLAFIDEAHQFLNKSIEVATAEDVSLNAFDLIAKECRKHGLYLCIATQMPRDIPVGTLSQMGTFIVHRLINEIDIEKIRNACADANKWVLQGLANLGQGEAILLSVNLPFPITVKIKKPYTEPVSKSPW